MCEFIYNHHAVSPHDCTNMVTNNASNHNVPENCIEASINKIPHMSSDLNTWTSKFVVTHGDKSINVSLAAQGHILLFLLESPPPKELNILCRSVVLMKTFFLY